MKLKNIASLALAGIMAVSMLAGCGTGTADSGSSSSEPVVDSSLAGQIIAKLDSATTKYTTFEVAGSQLNDALDKAVKANGAANTIDIDANKLLNIDPSLGEADYLPRTQAVNTNDTGDDSKEQKIVFVRSLTSTGANEISAAIQLAKAIDSVAPANGSGAGHLNWNKLPEKSLFDNADDQKAEYYWSFEYTAEVAATKVVNAADGTVDYIMAVVVTRTPTKVEL